MPPSFNLSLFACTVCQKLFLICVIFLFLQRNFCRNIWYSTQMIYSMRLLIYEGATSESLLWKLHKWIVLAEACLNIDRHNALIANFMDEVPNKCELDWAWLCSWLLRTEMCFRFCPHFACLSICVRDICLLVSLIPHKTSLALGRTSSELHRGG